MRCQNGANRKYIEMNKKILVVDDTSSIRESLGKVFRAEGYDVFLAADGRDGIAQFNAELMDLLVLDVNLPDINGWEVFGTLTKINPFLPVIVMTGHETKRNLATWGGSGALIQKPLDVTRLLETVAGLLGDSPATHIQRLAGAGSDLRYERTGAGGHP
jgi:DNA-binding response OmpR family regulator